MYLLELQDSGQHLVEVALAAAHLVQLLPGHLYTTNSLSHIPHKRCMHTCNASDSLQGLPAYLILRPMLDHKALSFLCTTAACSSMCTIHASCVTVPSVLHCLSCILSHLLFVQDASKCCLTSKHHVQPHPAFRPDQSVWGLQSLQLLRPRLWAAAWGDSRHDR